MKLALPLALLALAGCDAKAKSDACYASSVGSCSSEQATSCGVQLTCDDQIPRELKCTPPDSELPMACECIEAGMVTLRQDGFDKVRQGMTTIDEILRVTEATI